MTFTDDILNQIRECGKRQLPPRSVAIRLGLNRVEEMSFFDQFTDIESDVRRAWENGKMDKLDEIEDHLKDTVSEGKEGSGDAARAINYLQRKRISDDLKQELFGV